MKKIMNWMLAAIFICGSSVFASCVANEDNSSADVPGGEVTEPYVEPTDDQLEVKVTADMPTAVLAQFDESTVAAALIKRLPQTTTAINDDTKLVLLDDSQIKSLTEDDYFAMSRVIFNGGYVALHRPKFENALFFGVSLDDQFEKIQNAILKENGVEGADDEPAASRRNDGDMVRKVNNARALTRAEDDDPNAVIDELLIMSINASYLIPPYNEERIVFSKLEDDNGQESEPVEHKVKNLQNPYHYGRMADCAALWLNTKEQEKAESQQPAAARALTRADADQVINSMLSRTNEFTVPGHLWGCDDQGQEFGRANVSNTTIRSWSVHDFASNRDFYYVEENHHIRMGGQDSNKGNTLYWGPYKKEDWMWSKYPNTNTIKQFYLGGRNDRAYVYFYGNWLSESTHAMELEGNGEIQLEKSLPSTDNSQTTEIIAIGTTDGTSHTEGWSFGGSFGANGGQSGPNPTGGGNLGFNFSYTNTNTTSHSTSFTMSTSHVSKDLAIVKNTHGNEVTWTYKEGHTPKVIWDKGWHEMAADILTNDIDIENKVCWSVKKPSGSYTLGWYIRDYTKALYLNFQKNHSTFATIAYEDMDGFRLTPPRRFKKEWASDVRVYGEDLQKGALKDFIADLQEIINPTMFSNKFYVAESADDGLEVIKYNVGVATRILKTDEDIRDKINYRASLLGIDEFTVKWFPSDKKLKEKLKDNPITFTYKVSKK